MRVKFPSNDWATPKALYNELDLEFGFVDFDPCPLNCDLSVFDGLKADWPTGAIFVNPPYSLKSKTAFVMKALEASKKGATAVMLLPVSTSTKLFHEVIYPNAKIRFLDYRPKYEGINTKNQWVNPGLGRNTEALAKYATEAGLEQVYCSGAHDSMVIMVG